MEEGRSRIIRCEWQSNNIINPASNLVGMVFNMGYAVVAASVNYTC